MPYRFSPHPLQWLAIGLAILSVIACSLAQATQVTQIVEVTRLVPATVNGPPPKAEQGQPLPTCPVAEVTRLVQAPPVEVTRIVEGPVVVVTQIVEVPVEVIREVPVTRMVQTPQIPVFPLVITVPVPFTPVESGSLPLWYAFEDDFLATGKVTDLSGNGNDAQVVGPVGVTEGLSGGRAILFYGDGYILARSNPVARRSVVTISLWFKTDRPQDNLKMASAAWWSGGPGSGWVMATHIPEFWSDDTNGLYLPGQVNNDNIFPAGEWVHEAVTYDGSRIREFTNGQLVNNWQTTGMPIGGGQPMVVGGWPYTGFYFRGAIDEFRLFDRALSLAEIRELYYQR